MKNISTIIFLLFSTLWVNAQSELSFSPYEDCINCGVETLESTGPQYSIGVNLAKPISERFSILAGVNFNLWKQTINYYDLQYGYSYSERNEYLPSVSLNIGHRFVLKAFKKSGIFTATNINFAGYGESNNKRMSLSVEPALGFCKKIGERHDLAVSVGYDKLLTNYNTNSFQKLHPGRLNIKLGMTFNLLPKENSASKEAE